VCARVRARNGIQAVKTEIPNLKVTNMARTKCQELALLYFRIQIQKFSVNS